MSIDLNNVTRDWEFEPQRVNARWAQTDMGRMVLQLRMDLGVFQMELSGRPDGQLVHGAPTLLQHYLALEKALPADDPALRLDEKACGALQQEAMQFYYRYISFFALREFDGVIRDTSHNLKIIQYVLRHAPDELRRAFLPFFPYVQMMNGRGRAEKATAAKKFDEALAALEVARAEIEAFCTEHELGDLPVAAPALATLRELIEQVSRQKPRSPAERLREELDRAVASENYERAAALRDELHKLSIQATPQL
ncbi:MAG: UvrB/UvrC motif-containing protein [Kiritimatiellaeota bacterium]|nr:UvrB/UvrC motif-containing protein [Kiritimatiellota bacterium]